MNENRDIYKIEVNTSILPEVSQTILSNLLEEGVGPKGGLARSVLLKMESEKKDSKIDLYRLDIEENRLKDLDFVILYRQQLSKEKEFLLSREVEIRQKIQETLKEKNIRFDGRDIEPVRGSFSGDLKLKTITKILITRDLTINEVLLVPEEGKWYCYYTRQGRQDLISGIGMLAPNGWKTTRSDLGRLIPSNYGFFRLLRFWVEGKVSKIWLPKWMINVHLAEIQRLQDEGKLPEGATLGRYSRILVAQYRNADAIIKKRWMQTLNLLGFTDLASFDDYSKEQELLDGLTNDFDFEENISLKEVIEKTIKERQEKQNSRHIRNQEMEECIKHVFETTYCHNCKINGGCEIKKCVLCNHIEKPENMQCNEIFRTSHWKADTCSVLFFPRYYKLKTTECSILCTNA
jgi:hypothetical protein